MASPKNSDLHSSDVEHPQRVAVETRKPRMEWTEELHALFEEAVQDLGGLEFVSPKPILKKMKVEGLTLDHVKSHLQNIRKMRRASTRVAELPGRNTSQ